MLNQTRGTPTGKDVAKPIKNVAWPAAVEKLSFQNGFNEPIVGDVWPASLR